MIINGTDYGRLFDIARLRINEYIDEISSSNDMIKEKSNLLIISDGHANNTKIYCKGQILTNVTSIKINEILPGEPLIATIEVLSPKLHIRLMCNYFLCIQH